MTSPSSFNVSGLLSGVAGSIDTTSLISQLMQVQALPQTTLKNQLSVEQAMLTAYQGINSTLTAMQTAAQALIDPTGWQVTAATSSVPSVVASSAAGAAAGSTTFNVLSLAAAQVSTIAADSSNNVVTDPTAGITITDSSGQAHNIALTSAAATDVAAAINTAAVGIRANVITTSTGGQLLQLTAAGTGTSAAFTASTTGGFTNPVQNVVTAQNATVGVGDPANGGYVLDSQSNTFTNLIPGVTFTVSAVTSNVTIAVGSDEKAISDQVQALVTAANAAGTAISQATTNGGILQGHYEVSSIAQSLSGAVSQGTSTGGTLSTYGIDIDKNGVMSFDTAKFAAAYTADPTGTQNAISQSFATSLNDTATATIAPVDGSISSAITDATNTSADLNKQINDWTPRLTDIQATLQAKFSAMQTALAKLQSQSTYLTSMLQSATSSSNSNSNSN